MRRSVSKAHRGTKKTAPKKPQSVAILYFGASWCPPCHLMKKKVLPELEALGFQIRVFDVDETQKAGKELGVEPMDDRYAIKAMPTCVFVEARLLDVKASSLGLYAESLEAGRNRKDFDKIPQELGRVRGAEPLKLILAEIAKVEQYLANKKRLGVK